MRRVHLWAVNRTPIVFWVILAEVVAIVAILVWVVVTPEVAAPVAAPAIMPIAETCWSGTLAVQMPEYPDSWWVNYGERTDNQVQICGVGLRIGAIMAFPDLGELVIRLEDERDMWRDCAVDGPPLCPEEYFTLKKKRHEESWGDGRERMP